MVDLFEVMHGRKSVREFERYEATAEEIDRIVEAVRHAPSGKNSQPWKLFLLQGESIESLRVELCRRFDENAPAAVEFETTLLPAYKRRAVELGKSLFIHKGIAREDKAGRRLHDRENFKLFDAPQAFLLGVDRHAQHEGTIMDCGIFLGYLMLAVEGMGFGSCPQVSPLMYPDALRSVVPESEDIKFLCVLPFGKPLANSHVNKFTPTREPADVWFKKV